MGSRPPAGLGLEGRRLWRAIVDRYELEEHERTLLLQACRVSDTCARLHELVAADDVLDTNRLGERKAHPALVELRQQRILLARLLVALRVPLGERDDGDVDQHRGLRGVYGLGGS